jgi:cobalt-zinc-cadmium efflux system membrane fusion protein
MIAIAGWAHPCVAQQDDHGAGHERFIPEAGTRFTAEEWCFTHGVPESLCSRCDPSLIAGFKERGDWCGGHNIPESQCILCNAGFRERWAALRPAPGPAEESNRPLTAPRDPLSIQSDPLCPVEGMQIRFRDGTVAGKAGIEVEPAQLRRMSAVIARPGEARYDQNRLAHITPRASGAIVEVRSDVGDAVRSGDVLCVIDSPELGSAKSRYIELRETHRMAAADLARHNGIHEAVELMLAICTAGAPSMEVRDRLAGVRVGEPKSRLLKAHAELEHARTSYARERDLTERGISGAQAVQAAERDLRSAEADFAATREAIDLEIEREHLAAEREETVSRAALSAAERTLHMLGIGDDELGAILSAPDVRVSHYELRSPLNGTVARRHAVIGETVERQSVLFTVVDLSRMWILFDIRESDLSLVRTGQRVLFAPDGLPGVSVEATVDWVSTEVDGQTRSVKARARVDEGGGVLRDGMYGQARILILDSEERLSIPESAVQTDGCCQLVFVRQAEDLYVPRKVLLGARANGYVAVEKGVDLGEPVAVAGAFLLKTEILKSNIGAGCCEVDPGR